MISHSRPPNWRGFPSADAAKVWISEGDRVGDALELYHPYSAAGQIAKTLFTRIPSSLASKVLRGSPSNGLAERMDMFTATIRDVLGNDRLAVSFSPGTPGRHRKLTARASDNGTAVAYVKIVEDRALSILVENEADMLAWLKQEGLASAVLPEVLALERRSASSLLFLGAPAGPGIRKSLKADHREVGFLSELASLNGTSVPVASFVETWGIGGLVDRLRTEAPANADTMSEALAYLKSSLGETGVRLCAVHGDYAPWNTLQLRSGDLYVFDWEYGTRHGPALTDLFHRIVMPARLVDGEKPGRVMRRLLVLPDHPALRTAFRKSGVSRDQLPAYILIYLLGSLSREIAQQGSAGSFLSDCIRLLLHAIRPSPQKRKILAGAYACEPGIGSEPGVGWHVCWELSQKYEVWAITKDNNRQPIEAELARTPNPDLHFVYVGVPRWLTFWKKGLRGVRTYYYLWQFASWWAARKLGRDIRFDLACHITFLNDWIFPFVSLLPYPFVWGPIGSHPWSPKHLMPNKGDLWRNRAECAFKSLVRSVDPFYWACALRAKLTVGNLKELGHQFPHSLLSRDKFITHTSIGVEALFDRPEPSAAREGPLRVLFMGRLVSMKGCHLAIRAFARLVEAQPTAQFLIVGRGPEQDALVRLADELGVDRQVEFRDWMPREQALAEMGKADVFIFPSVEGAGMVVLEAMAHGVPVVCLDFGGPGEVMTEECGFAVEVGTMEDTVARLGEALVTLAGDEERRKKAGAAGRQRVKEHYLWKKRADTFEEWFRAILIDADRSSLDNTERGR